MLIAKVIVDLSLDRSFDYLVPDELAAEVRPGSRVLVPFGHTRKSGCVLALAPRPEDPRIALKAIAGLCANSTQIPEPLLELGRWMADYYCCTREQAIRALLPGAVRRARKHLRQHKLYAVADPDGCDNFIKANAGKKTAARRIVILQELLRAPGRSLEQLQAETDATPSILQTLLKAGLVAVSGHAEVEVELRRKAREAKVVPDTPREPTPEQRKALDGIFALLDHPGKSPHTGLLFGITGSGKTEVYLQAIARTLELGRSAIVLVPEISLTPQTVRRFRARFGDALSVMHSRLSGGERLAEWNRVRDGEVRIVVGARSALFAPLANLGLIVVDEEHESSYKQSEAPRYSARDVAVMRGKLEQAAVVLGSATPSLESYYHALHGKYALWTLTSRAEHSLLPEVHVVDLHLAKGLDPDDKRKNPLFTPELIAAVRERLRLGEQIILFLNRRGFARELSCPEADCTWVAECPDCSRPYLYHRERAMLSCGLCGRLAPVPPRCPLCGAEVFRMKGTGTEKIEDIARRLFPGARIARMDSDSMRKAGAHEITLERFRRGETDILIGTQMIAKGLDFPNVTLVGIINADAGLNIPDVRAAERTFQLLTQVAGRAGRGSKAGEVIVQTFSPYHDVIRFAVAQDFPAFYEYDIAVREILKYPPFGHLIALYGRGEDEMRTAEAIAHIVERVRSLCGETVTVVEPAPAPLARVKGKYRYVATFRGEKLTALRRCLRQLVLGRPEFPGVELYLDVDALSLA